jgi:membrane dipeptidase
MAALTLILTFVSNTRCLPTHAATCSSRRHSAIGPALRVVVWILFAVLTASVRRSAGAIQQQGPPADSFPIDTNVTCAAASGQPPGTWTIKLPPAQEKRAMEVYRRSIVITAHDHCFLPGDFLDQEKAGITVRVIKPLTDGYYRKGADRFPIENPIDGWAARGEKAIAILKGRATESHGKLEVVRRVADIERLKRKKKFGMILSFEGGRPLQGKLENVALFHRLGLRELQLHWAVSSPLKNADGTLSPFAEDVIREMNRLGIVLDISHMPEPTFSRALELTKNPVVISHCAVAFMPRSSPHGNTDNLDDSTIRRIAANGGVICIHFYEGYIHPRHGTRYPTVEDMVDHIDYIKKLVGIDYVGLGPDYSPMKGWRWIEGAERMEGMPSVAREMVRRGYTDQEIAKVLGLNLLRVYHQVWGK